jgi:LysM repeat protein
MPRLWIALSLCALLLAGCFRDASDQGGDPTSRPVGEFLTTPTITTTPQNTGIPTLTTTPPRRPTSTLPLGGPPVEEGTEEVEEASSDPESTLPPTRAIPSFTPGGSTFGDSGITPTNVIGTQPVPNALITPTGAATENLECIYVVQPNDTLFRISETLEVTVDELIAVNAALAANPNSLQIGQQLAVPNCVPGQSAAPAATTAPGVTGTPAPSGTRTHVVAAGDSLFRIALQYDVALEDLLAANGLNENSIIQPGQEIVIP